jgi:serine/threonine-protein kinase HipA
LLANIHLILHHNAMKCTIQIYLNGEWRPIATFEPFRGAERGGYAGCGGYLEHHPDYVIDFFQSSKDKKNPGLPRLSLPIPVTLALDKYRRWPAFLLDLLPTGAGRRVLVDRMHLTDGPAADWDLLLGGARYPVGWLRILPGDGEDVNDDLRTSRGFTPEEVAAREQNFLEYMIEQGASIAGSSDVQGEAPKLLLTEDEDGLFHADGALPDYRARRHWLVKFSRKRTELERKILRNECGYLHLAHLLGANVHDVDRIHMVEGRALFIPRFDRVCTEDNAVLRYGLESFASAAGVDDFGQPAKQEVHCGLILDYSSSPAEDLLEYLRRDVLNVCMGNVDNHARNHAFRKHIGAVRLSPLYDFAPMSFSDDGFARVARWGKEKERRGQPDWTAVGSYVAGLNGAPSPASVADMFAFLAHNLARIETIAKEVAIDHDFILRLKLLLEENVRGLDSAAEKVAKL